MNSICYDKLKNNDAQWQKNAENAE
jgi:hypothetical protein